MLSSRQRVPPRAHRPLVTARDSTTHSTAETPLGLSRAHAHLDVTEPVTCSPARTHRPEPVSSPGDFLHGMCPTEFIFSTIFHF